MLRQSNRLAIFCDIYIVIWAIYCIHWYSIMPGTLIDSISSLFLAINLLFSFVCLYLIQKQKLPPFFKAINILLIVFFIYGMFPIINGGEIYKKVDISPGAYLMGPLRSFLPIYAFYFFSIKGVISEKRMKVYFFIFTLLYLFFFVSFSNIKMEESSRDAFTNNLGYIFASLSPFVLLVKKRLTIKYVSLFFILIVILLSMKRGAILVGVYSLIFIVTKQWRSSTLGQKLFFAVLFSAISFLVYSYSYSFFSSNEYFMMRVEDTLSGDSSGRDGITKDVFHYYLNETTLFEMLFGGGADQSMYVCGGYQAHNDWLEILVDQGLFGIFIYLFFWIMAYRQIKLMREGTIEKQILSLTLVSIFMKTFFSMSYAAFPTTYGLLIGYCLAQYSKGKTIEIYNKNE